MQLRARFARLAHLVRVERRVLHVPPRTPPEPSHGKRRHSARKHRQRLGRLPLTIYQDHPGLPAWCAGEQAEDPEWRQRELRSAELFAWYEGRLALQQLFAQYAEPLRRWRQAYPVSESEVFLLTWNVLGLVAATRGIPIRTYARSEYDFGVPDSENAAVATLGARRRSERVHFCDPVAFNMSGKALLPSGEVVDLWEQALDGRTPETLAAALVEQIGGANT
jgi:hypothetical protein